MNNIPDFRNEKLVRNEDLFPISKQDLKSILHRSIGAITFLNGMKQLTMGSGVLISPDLVLTVAHNLYDKKY
jgi:hypothetical protein